MLWIQCSNFNCIKNNYLCCDFTWNEYFTLNHFTLNERTKLKFKMNYGMQYFLFNIEFRIIILLGTLPLPPHYKWSLVSSNKIIHKLRISTEKTSLVNIRGELVHHEQFSVINWKVIILIILFISGVFVGVHLLILECKYNLI